MLQKGANTSKEPLKSVYARYFDGHREPKFFDVLRLLIFGSCSQLTKYKGEKLTF